MTKEQLEAFIKDYEALCKKHNISLSHEDKYGAFEFEEYLKDNIEWVQESANIYLWKNRK